MNIFDFYADPARHKELGDLLTLGAQQHPGGLGANFLEKDIWVTEILRLLFDEGLIGNYNTAFKGGTALSKCWGAIQRFSEDIDLSIHWSDLAEEKDETKAWAKSTSTRSQRDKFRDRQTELLTGWSTDLVSRLNDHFSSYRIAGLHAELEDGSKGEKINIQFPQFSADVNTYQLDHILLEFGGRNRGRPTIPKELTSYLSEISELSPISFPSAKVEAYDPAYILWEKLTALHQFCTQTNAPNPTRLSRHWYDVDCLLQQNFADPIANRQAMLDVVEMKKWRWASPGVDYEQVSAGNLSLIPAADRIDAIARDHQEAIEGRMFFGMPEKFEKIIERLRIAESNIKKQLKSHQE